jgi:hypothetical protein
MTVHGQSGTSDALGERPGRAGRAEGRLQARKPLGSAFSKHSAKKSRSGPRGVLGQADRTPDVERPPEPIRGAPPGRANFVTVGGCG